MRVAIVHDWLIVYGGAERVLQALIEIFPDADLFSVVDYLSEDDRRKLGGKVAATTFIQHLPFARRRYRDYLPLMPLAIEQLDLSGYDLIISSSHAVAKGVLVGPDQFHVSYVHSPMRYAWDMQHQYLRESRSERGLKSWLMRLVLHYLRVWDQRTASGVDLFLSNSRFIARRIWKTYGRHAVTVYPPVDVIEDASRAMGSRDDYYIVASRMVPYKRVDLVVEAFNLMPSRKLRVVGSGPELERIRHMANDNVEVLGYVPDDELRRLLAGARAFVFAAEEDFGILPVEAQGNGTPVIAYAKGGALETVVGDGPDRTGLFFREQTAGAIRAAVEEFEADRMGFSASACIDNAGRFSATRFAENFLAAVMPHFEEFRRARGYAAVEEAAFGEARA